MIKYSFVGQCNENKFFYLAAIVVGQSKNSVSSRKSHSDDRSSL